MTAQNKPFPIGFMLEIIAFVIVVIADSLGYVPLTQTLFLVPLIWMLLRLRAAAIFAAAFL